MAFQDYFALFGIPPTAGEAEVRGAYRRLVLQFHPDRNPSDPAAESKFKEIAEAYRTLSDPKLRAAYTLRYAAFQDSLRNRQMSAPAPAQNKPSAPRRKEKIVPFRYLTDAPVLDERDLVWGAFFGIAATMTLAMKPALYPPHHDSLVWFLLPLPAAVGGGLAGWIGASFARAFLSAADNWTKWLAGYFVGTLVSLGTAALLSPFAVLLLYGLFFSTRFYHHLFVGTAGGLVGGFLAMLVGSRRKK